MGGPIACIAERRELEKAKTTRLWLFLERAWRNELGTLFLVAR